MSKDIRACPSLTLCPVFNLSLTLEVFLNGNLYQRHNYTLSILPANEFLHSDVRTLLEYCHMQLKTTQHVICCFAELYIDVRCDAGVVTPLLGNICKNWKTFLWSHRGGAYSPGNRKDSHESLLQSERQSIRERGG